MSTPSAATSICLLALACATTQEPYAVELPLARAEVGVETPPPVAGAEHLRVPPVSEDRLDNGMLVRIVERPGTGLVSMVYATGTARLGSDYMSVFIGDALLAAARRADGTLLYPVRVEGGLPDVGTGPSGTTIALDCAARDLPSTLELLAAVVQRPAFDANALVPVRSRTRLDLLGMSRRYWEWSLALSHGGRSYDIDLDGFATKLPSLDERILRQAHREYYAPEESALIVVGDLPRAQLLAAVKSQFAAWQPRERAREAVRSRPPRAASAPAQRGASTPARAESAKPRSGRRLVIARSEGYPSVALVQDAPASNSPDAVAFELLSRLLVTHGGSSLFSTLRYERAHAYAVGAYALTVPGQGRYLFINTAVAAQTIATDVSEALAALQRLRTQPVNDSDLAGVKAAFRAMLASTLSSGEGLARYLAKVYLLESPALEEIEAQLETIGGADLQRVAAQYLDPERATIGVMGDVSSALGQLKTLGESEPSDEPTPEHEQGRR